MKRDIFILGDIHGQLDKMQSLLLDAGLIGPKLNWRGKNAHLYFLGDYVDRGPDGIGVIDMVMRLQVEASMNQGKVEALLGNHDVMLLAAKLIGNDVPEGSDMPLRYLWQQNGGRRKDITSLTDDHVAWLKDLPAMALVEDTLLVHADACFYSDYGATVDSVNASIADVLSCGDYQPFADLIVAFIRRMEFSEKLGGSTDSARAFLKQFGARRLVHGHTPIPMMQREKPGPVAGPYVYAQQLCTNIDSGLFLGEKGFVYQLMPETEEVPH